MRLRPILHVFASSLVLVTAPVACTHADPAELEEDDDVPTPPSQYTTRPDDAGQEDPADDPPEPYVVTGHYSGGFGYGSITACGSEDSQSLSNLGHVSCPPLLVELEVIRTDDWEDLEVLNVLRGPCAFGDCDDPDTWWGCEDDFSLCNRLDECGIDCDPLEPNQCPDGYTCTIAGCDAPHEPDGVRWTPKCRPAGGTAQVDEPCTPAGPDTDDAGSCAEGLSCYGKDAEGNRVCDQHCVGDASDPTCPLENSGCLLYCEGSISLCRPSCDPVAEAPCENPADGCFCATGDSGFACATAVEDTPYGESCSFANSCGVGGHCTGAEHFPEDVCSQGSCCGTFCDLTQPNDCPDADAGQVCAPLPHTAVAGWEHVGRCTMPAE